MKTATQRYDEAMNRLDDRFADNRLHDEWVAAIEAAVDEERARCAAIARKFGHSWGKHVAVEIERTPEEAERSKTG